MEGEKCIIRVISLCRRSLAYSSDSRSKAASVSQKGRANLWDEVLPEFPEQVQTSRFRLRSFSPTLNSPWYYPKP